MSDQQLVQELKANSDLPIIEIVPHDDKLARFYQIVPIIESGKVFLPHQATWLNDFFIMFNAGETPVSFTVCPPLEGKPWVRAIDTSLPSPEDICTPGMEEPLVYPDLYIAMPRSMVVLISKQFSLAT